MLATLGAINTGFNVDFDLDFDFDCVDDFINEARPGGGIRNPESGMRNAGPADAHCQRNATEKRFLEFRLVFLMEHGKLRPLLLL